MIATTVGQAHPTQQEEPEGLDHEGHPAAAHPAEVGRGELAAYDPRGRVTVICGRCGQPALSETTPTILAHYKRAHDEEPQARLVGGNEWMHSLGYGPLDEDEQG